MKSTSVLTRCLSIILVLFLCISEVPYASAASDKSDASADDEPTIMTAEQRNSINMLNYLTVLVQEINSSGNSRLFLESAYSELINNTEPSIVDEMTLCQYENILTAIEKYRMIAVKRERLQYLYEQNSAAAIRSAMPNPLALLNVIQSGGALKAIVSVAYLAFDSVTSYETYTDTLEMQYLQDGWALDDEEASVLVGCRSSMFSYMVRVARDLPRGLTLNEDSVEAFVEWKSKPNATSRIRWLESHRSTYENYGEYWLLLADSYYEKAQSGDTSYYYQKCINAINTYDSLDNSIFRKDTRLSQSLPYAIIAAQEVMSESEYIIRASKYAQRILDNTDDKDGSDWSLRYFAAQTFIDLYARTNQRSYLQKAYDVAYDNVNMLISEQRSQNVVYLADIVTESTKGVKDKDQKKQIENYNKLLKETRKSELAPIYEPLRLNCDLLFALADELGISASGKKDIQEILHPGGAALFLNPAIDSMYNYSDSAVVSADSIEVTFEKGQLTIPAVYLCDSSSIVVSVSNGSSVQAITDWQIEEVDRKKSHDAADFVAVFTSDEAKDITYNDGDQISITVTPLVSEGNLPEPLMFSFKADKTTVAWVVHPLSFTRVYE